MTQQAQYWKNRCEAAENYARLKGNSIDESEPELNARLIWEGLACHEPPDPAQVYNIDKLVSKMLSDTTIADLSALSDADKSDFISGLVKLMSGQVMTAFAALGLKSHMTGVVEHPETKEKFDFIFAKAGTYVEAFTKPAPAQGVEEAEESASAYAKGLLGEYDPEYQEEYDAICAHFSSGWEAHSRWQQGQEEIEELRRWKAEALKVMPDFQAIGNALGIPIGETIHDKILPGIEKLKERAATPTIGARWVKAGEDRPGIVSGKQHKYVCRDSQNHAIKKHLKPEYIPVNYEWLDESPATFPTREQAIAWADGCYPGDDVFAVGARNYMIEMYDWITSQLKDK